VLAGLTARIKQTIYLTSNLQIYERGLEAIPLSVDLWLSYIGYVREIAQGQRQAGTKIREYVFLLPIFTPGPQKAKAMNLIVNRHCKTALSEK
jgi:hypothetical protein